MRLDSKRSQMEILGLAVIVLLVSVALLFFITSSLKSKPSKQKETFENKMISTQTINVLLKTSSGEECGYAEMSKVIINMFEDDSLCKGGSREYAENKVKEIFDKTLKYWEKDYEFKIYSEHSDISMELSSKTGETISVEASTYTLPTTSDTIIVSLAIINSK